MMIDRFKKYKNKYILRVGGILIVSLLLLSTSAVAVTTVSESGDESRTASETLDIPTAESTFAQSAGGAQNSPATPTEGDVILPVVLVEFEDAKHKDDAKTMQKRMFGQGSNNQPSREGVREYFYDVSDGKLDYNPGPGVIGWQTLSMKRSDTGDPNAYPSYIVNDPNIPGRVVERFVHYSLTEVDKSVDFSKYDGDNNNRINVVIVYQGTVEEQITPATDPLSPISTELNPHYQSPDGVTIEQVSLVPEQDREATGITDNGRAVKGIWYHELGHSMFGWNDLYEPSNAGSINIQLNPKWSIMGRGPEAADPHTRIGEKPIAPLSWEKTATGWADAPRFSGSGILPPASVANDFYRANPLESLGIERFLSFRPDTGVDSGLRSLHENTDPSPSPEVEEKARFTDYQGLLTTETNLVPNSPVSDSRSSGARLINDYVASGDRFGDSSEYDLKRVSYDKGTLQLGEPPEANLESGSKLVYAMEVPTKNDKVGVRASWDNPSAHMDLTLYSPSGTKHSTQNKGPQSTSDVNVAGTYTSLHTDQNPKSGGWKVQIDTTEDVEFYHSETDETALLPSRVELDIPDDKKVYPSDTSLEFKATVKAGDGSYPKSRSTLLDKNNFNIFLNKRQLPSDQLTVQPLSDGSYKISVSLDSPLKQATPYLLEVSATDTKFGVTHETDPKQYRFTTQNSPPEAEFDYTTDGLAVQFNSRSTDPDGSDTKLDYKWNFGDGSNSIERSPKTTYNEPGDYTITLDVTDQEGDTDRITRNIKVSLDGVFSIQNTHTEKFLTSTLNQEVSSESVNGQLQPEHAWVVVSAYSDKYKISRLNSERSLSEYITISGPNKAQLTPWRDDLTQQRWYIEPKSSNNEYQIKNFETTNKLTDPDSDKITVESKPKSGNKWYLTQLTKYTQDNRAPKGNFKVQGSTFTKTFIVADLNDPDGQITNYELDFDDGNSTTITNLNKKKISHPYTEPGEYTVSLRISDNDGDSRTITRKVSVTLSGTYKIKNANDKRLLTARSNGELQLEADYQKPEQLWEVSRVEQSDGEVKYRITSVPSGKTIVVTNRVSLFYDYAVLRTWKNDPDHLWKIRQQDTKKGRYTMENIGFGRILGRQGNPDVEANSVLLSGRDTEYNQWELISVAS